MAGIARAMGATVIETQKLLGKYLNFIYSFLKLYLAPPTINCNAASTQRLHLMQGKLCQNHQVF